jgi:hypothetical protein
MNSMEEKDEIRNVDAFAFMQAVIIAQEEKAGVSQNGC